MKRGFNKRTARQTAATTSPRLDPQRDRTNSAPAGGQAVRPQPTLSTGLPLDTDVSALCTPANDDHEAGHNGTAAATSARAGRPVTRSRVDSSTPDRSCIASTSLPFNSTPTIAWPELPSSPAQIRPSSEASATPLLTPTEVAEYLGICTKTLYAEIRDGKLRALPVRGQWRMRRQDIKDYLEATLPPLRLYPAKRRARRDGNEPS